MLQSYAFYASAWTVVDAVPAYNRTTTCKSRWYSFCQKSSCAPLMTLGRIDEYPLGKLIVCPSIEWKALAWLFSTKQSVYPRNIPILVKGQSPCQLGPKPEFFYSPKVIALTRKIPYTMASHHHLQHQSPSHRQSYLCHPPTSTTSTVCFCCYCCPNNTPSHHHPPVPDPHHLHHHPPRTNFYSSYTNGPNPDPPYTAQTHHHHNHHHPQPPSDHNKEHYFHQLHQEQQTELTCTHPIVSSLLRRISALESSLCHHSSSHSHSLRDAAASTIQTHFRAFLVRRSRALRQLKDLASIKSTLNILKSSVSENLHFDPQSLSRKVLKLLFKLDSIQGGDPMIRDGKKSISRELTCFLDLIHGVTVKKSEISARLVKKNATRRCGVLYNDQERGTIGCLNSANNKRLEDLVDMINALSTQVPDEEDLEIPGISQNRTAHLGKRNDGLGAKVKKSFVENGKVYKVRRNRFGPVSVGDCDSSSGDESYSVDAKGDLEGGIRRKAEVGGISFKETQVDVEDQSQDGESSKSSGDGEEGPVYELRKEDGGFTFSAPLPVKMETRADIMDRRKTVKIVE